MRHNAFPSGISREGLVEWYRRLRARSHALFAIAEDDAWYDRPIPLRNPLVFYDGHLPAFAVNTLVKGAHGRDGVDPELEVLFARGIDPEDESAVRDPASAWPSRERVRQFTEACDALIEDALRNAPLEDDRVPSLRGGEAVLTILEHEAMHQETVSYLLHAMPWETKRRGAFTSARRARRLPPAPPVLIPPGRATLGSPRDSYGWDNEFPSSVVDVPSFSIDAFSVTNGDYLEFVEATGVDAPHFWIRGERDWYLRGMFEALPLDLDAPVYVTQEEAARFAQWRGKRLPSEAEFHRAAFGTPEGEERAHPWGDALPWPERHGSFDFASLDPVPAGAFPEGASAWGVHDLVGNGWEWTATLFAGFDGFEPMPSYPQYSADFFDDAHYVLKGASPATPRELIRRGFRNWFRPNYPYVYAKFRCVA